MAKSAIPPDHRDWPDHEHREYPKHLGFDENGVDIEVKDEDEEIERIGDVVFPKLLGKDRLGKEVVAMWPHEEGWKSKLVVAPKPAPQPEPVKAAEPPKEPAPVPVPVAAAPAAPAADPAPAPSPVS